MDDMSKDKIADSLSFSAFEAVSLEEWMAKIKQDLKGKDWEEYFWEIEPGITINPAQFDSEKEYQPIFSRKENFWIGQELQIDGNYVLTNDRLLKLLMMGVSSPKLQFANVLTTPDWLELLNKVEIEYLSLQLHFRNLEMAVASINNLPEEYAGIIGDIGIIGTANHSFELIHQCHKEHAGLKCLIVSSSNNGFVDQLADVLIQLYALIQQAEHEKLDAKILLSNLTLELSLGNQLIAEIAKLRAMRLLIELFFHQYKLSTASITYRAIVNSEALSNEPELDVIRLTSIALGANLGGVDALNFPVLSKEKKDFFQRITSNIQHLFTLESHLGKVGDPLAGSHFIERLTDQLAGAAWQKFQEGI